jgi:pyrroline-5-carboxylate reductase
MIDRRIGFIGAGQMARALARGFVQAGLVAPTSLVAYDPHADTVRQLASDISGLAVAADNAAVALQADILIIAVKPQHVPAALAELEAAITPQHLVMSVAAGVTLRALSAGLGTERIVRVMPNTPALVGRGAAAFSLGAAVTPQDAKLVAELMSAVGMAIPLDERLLDAVTGLSGSGPAFVYLMIEALSDAGVRVGLPRASALALAAQTVRGAAEMVICTGEHPAVLKDKVASPAGTTIAGLSVLEQQGVRGALISAVVAATERSRELGQ